MDEDDHFVFANSSSPLDIRRRAGTVGRRPSLKLVDARNAEIVRGQNTIRRRGGKSVYEQEIVQAGGDIRRIRMSKVSPQFDHKRLFKGIFRGLRGHHGRGEGA